MTASKSKLGSSHEISNNIDVTEQIIKAGNILQIPLIDHIIYCEGEYYSIYGDEEKVHEYGKTDL